MIVGGEETKQKIIRDHLRTEKRGGKRKERLIVKKAKTRKKGDYVGRRQLESDH